MTFFILFGLVFLLDGFFLREGLLHLKEVTGPWSLNTHEYDA